MNKFLSSLLVLLLAGASAASVHAEGPPGDAKAGEKINAMCIGCHSIKGYQASFPQIHKVPMIAGQSAGYITAALQAYKAGERKHPTMRGIADSLTDKDMANLAAFYAQSGAVQGLSAPAKSALPSDRLAKLLSRDGAACASCHGDNLSAPIAPNIPKIAGQHADYLYVALQAYQTEGNRYVGRGNAVMGAVAKNFTHAELQELAAYIARLPSELKTVPQKPFK